MQAHIHKQIKGEAFFKHCISVCLIKIKLTITLCTIKNVSTFSKYCWSCCSSVSDAIQTKAGQWANKTCSKTDREAQLIKNKMGTHATNQQR